MVVGTALVFLWRTFFPRTQTHHRRRSHSHKSAARDVSAVAEEKAGLVEHQEPPPSYEEGVEGENAKVDV
jgi:hypothetical protein